MSSGCWKARGGYSRAGRHHEAPAPIAQETQPAAACLARETAEAITAHNVGTLVSSSDSPSVHAGGFLLRRSVQNHSPGMYWSRINTERDRSKPTPLNSATVTNVSMLAIDVADARGKIILAIAAVMSLSKFFGDGLRLMLCPVVNKNSQPIKR